MPGPEALADKTRRTLQQNWEEILQIPLADLETTSFVKDAKVRGIIHDLLNARTKAFRYAALTQTLAKAAEHSLSCFALQAGANLAGAFDARSLCRQVVVPFEQKHLGGALGNSPDPYVSKPLRRPRMSLEPDVVREIKHPKEWEKLYTLLDILERQNDPDFTQQVLKQILLEIRKLSAHQFSSLPEKVTAEMIRAILAEYLDLSTLGLGPQAVAYSLLEVFNRRTGTYHQVSSAPPTSADISAGRVADIECRDEKGLLRLAVYVTRRLDLQKLEYELAKCKENEVSNALFLAFEIGIDLQEAYKKAAEYKVNATIDSLLDFALSVTVLLNNQMRKELIEQTAIVLRNWGGANAIREFNEVVTRILQKE
jgi:hypothetical protein